MWFARVFSSLYPSIPAQEEVSQAISQSLASDTASISLQPGDTDGYIEAGLSFNSNCNVTCSRSSVLNGDHNEIPRHQEHYPMELKVFTQRGLDIHADPGTWWSDWDVVNPWWYMLASLLVKPPGTDDIPPRHGLGSCTTLDTSHTTALDPLDPLDALRDSSESGYTSDSSDDTVPDDFYEQFPPLHYTSTPVNSTPVNSTPVNSTLHQQQYQSKGKRSSTFRQSIGAHRYTRPQRSCIKINRDEQYEESSSDDTKRIITSETSLARRSLITKKVQFKHWRLAVCLETGRQVLPSPTDGEHKQRFMNPPVRTKEPSVPELVDDVDEALHWSHHVDIDTMPNPDIFSSRPISRPIPPSSNLRPSPQQVQQFKYQDRAVEWELDQASQAADAEEKCAIGRGCLDLAIYVSTPGGKLIYTCNRLLRTHGFDVQLGSYTREEREFARRGGAMVEIPDERWMSVETSMVGSSGMTTMPAEDVVQP